MAKGKVVKSGVLGAAVGIVAGLLLAPKSGRETRQGIKQAANRAVGSVERQLKQLYRDLSQAVGEAELHADKLKGKSAVELAGIIVAANKVKTSLKELLSTVRDGEADEDDIERVLKNGQAAIRKLTKRIKN